MSSEDLFHILESSYSIGILHHWDADGIASATMIMSMEGSVCVNQTPPIGNYTDFEDELKRIDDKNPDLVLGLDLAVSGEKLREMNNQLDSQLVWIDHHSNPPSGIGGVKFLHPDNFPGSPPESNALFLSWLVDRVDLLAAIGMCGDLGKRLLNHPLKKRVEKITLSNDLDIQELFKVTNLIDSNYMANEKRTVELAPSILLENLSHPRELLRIDSWVENKKAVGAEIDRILGSDVENRNQVVVKTIDTEMHLTSIIARKKALQEKGRKIAVIVRNMGHENARLYVRRTGNTPNLIPLIKTARLKGYSAGGKPEVVGMVLPKGEVEKMTDVAIQYVEERSQ